MFLVECRTLNKKIEKPVLLYEVILFETLLDTKYEQFLSRYSNLSLTSWILAAFHKCIPILMLIT